jgi:hypothetical protein
LRRQRHTRIAGVVETDELRRPARLRLESKAVGIERAVRLGRDRRHVERLIDPRLDVEIEVDADPLEEGVVE